jgi:mRNA interferase MazF
LIINIDALGKLPLKIVDPITDRKEYYGNYPWIVKIIPTGQNGLKKVSAVYCFQIRSVSVEPEIIIQIQEAVIKAIGAI